MLSQITGKRKRKNAEKEQEYCTSNIIEFIVTLTNHTSKIGVISRCFTNRQQSFAG